MAVLSTKPTTAWAEIDEDGRLILPPQVTQRFGLLPGSKVRLDEGHNFVRMGTTSESVVGITAAF